MNKYVTEDDRRAIEELFEDLVKADINNESDGNLLCEMWEMAVATVARDILEDEFNVVMGVEKTTDELWEEIGYQRFYVNEFLSV